MYSFHPPTQPPSNQGIGEMGVPPLSEQPFTNIRDNGFPVDLRVNPDVTYDTQIAVNRPLYLFDLSMQPTSNEGVGEMDGSPPSDHSFPGTHDDFPVAPLDLLGNIYGPQFSVDPSQTYSLNPQMQPTSNEGMGAMDGPLLSEHSLTDIRDSGFPAASLEPCVNSDVTYDTQIAVNRPPIAPMYLFDLSMQPTSNEGVGEMDVSPPSGHSFPGTHDNSPVAPLDLPGIMYEPQFSVDRPQAYSFNPPTQPPSNQGIGEMGGPPPSERPFTDIRDHGFPVASLDPRVNTYDTQINVNRPQIYSSGPPMQPTSNQGINEMDGPLLSGHTFPGFNDNGPPLASLDPCENSDATYGPHISVVGSPVSCGAPPSESTRTDVQNRPHLHSFNSPIPPALTIIPHTPPPIQPGEESEPQGQPHQSSGEASPELPAATDEAPDRLFLCDSCDKEFKQPQGLNRHKREKHDPSWCIYCDTTFGRSYLYREHLKRCHPNVNLDAVLGKPEGSHRRAAIMARDSQQQPKLPLLAAA